MKLRLGYSSLLLIAVILTACARPAAESTFERERKPANPLPARLSAILFREDREQLEQPEKILDAMNLQDGDIVADIGSGPGYYSLRVAHRIAPTGVVFAVDIQQGMLDQLQQRMNESGIKNVYPILGTEDSPNLPAGKIDWVLLVDAYHEFSKPEPMLAEIRECLAPGGKIALLEYRAEQDPSTLPVPIPRDHKMTKDEAMSEWTAAGFELVEFHEFLPAQHYFIFQKAPERRSWWPW
jgi:ubiquinone/menaquinone biosynthesis C-methylase UbiE